MPHADAGHVPVLAGQVVRLLDPQVGDTVLDCTVGRGGHAVLLADRVGPLGRLLAFDLDAANLTFAADRVARATPGLERAFHHTSFVEAPAIMRKVGARADVVLADLGFSSTQVDDASRGLSFQENGPLDMRLDQSRGPTAADLIRTLPERELADLIHRLGEEPLARRIARILAQQRRVESIDTTATLARLVREAYGSRARTSRIDPATRTFMALRIAVNDELNALRVFLEAIDREARRLASNGPGDGWLNSGARVGFISFHSLEDREVKQAFRSLVRDGLAEDRTRKVVVADDDEVASNPRARSAKLRVIRVVSTGAGCGESIDGNRSMD